MGIINILDEITANQIAAGEVVERPASVVKELVENSLDAGASSIIVELTQGGLTAIKVVDNGQGMTPEDALICFQRHATSKIKEAADLNRILTLGFRGEALPSIVSVARVTLTTRHIQDLGGIRIIVEAGQVRENVAIGCPVGTTVEVRELFFNTPARRKYLKSPIVESGLVSELISKLILARPDVKFELRSNGKTVLQSPGCNRLKEAAASVLGSDNVKSMLEVNHQGSLLNIKGLISKPALTRSSRNYQSIFINGRYIKSGLISAAIHEAYQSQVPSGRFPLAVLSIDIDPGMVDVNVHPTKIEVRLAQEKEVYQELLAALSKTLSFSTAIPGLWEVLKTRHGKEDFEDAKPSDIPEERSEKLSKPVRQDTHRQLGMALARQPVNSFDMEKNEDIVKRESAIINDTIAAEKIISYTAEADFPILTPVGQVAPTYVLAQGQGGLYIIDQHAAHERILYEKYLEQLEQGTGSQILLEPLTTQLSHYKARVVTKYILEFNKLGFILEHFGGDTFILRGAPLVAGSAPLELFLDLLDRLSENNGTNDSNSIIKELAASLACRDAVKSGQAMAQGEIQALIEGLSCCCIPYTCPHGRPTMINISQEELKRRFKR